MRTRIGTGGLTLALPLTLTAAIVLAGCSGEKRGATTAQAPAAPPPAATPIAPLTPPAPATPVRPEGADAIDAALAAAKAFNAKALTDLAAIEKAEKRVRDQASRALDSARRGEAARVAAARNDAEAAHRSLADGLSTFRTAAAEQQAAVATALALCPPPAAAPGVPTGATLPPPPPVTTPVPGTSSTSPPGVAPVYEGCTALIAEQALLAQNIEAVGARYQAAEASYRQDRPRLEEAAATVALGKLGPL